MTITMDPTGRLAIPSRIRREAGLEPGVPLTVRWHEGFIEIERRPLAVTLARKGRLLTFNPRHVDPAPDGINVIQPPPPATKGRRAR